MVLRDQRACGDKPDIQSGKGSVGCGEDIVKMGLTFDGMDSLGGGKGGLKGSGKLAKISTEPLISHQNWSSFSVLSYTSIQGYCLNSRRLLSRREG